MVPTVRFGHIDSGSVSVSACGSGVSRIRFTWPESPEPEPSSPHVASGARNRVFAMVESDGGTFDFLFCFHFTQHKEDPPKFLLCLFVVI